MRFFMLIKFVIISNRRKRIIISFFNAIIYKKNIIIIKISVTIMIDLKESNKTEKSF